MDLRGFKKVGNDLFAKPLYDSSPIIVPTKIADCHETVGCYRCGACFEQRHVVLKRAQDICTELTPNQTVYFVDGEGYIKTTEKHYKFELFDKLMFCPACDIMNLTGFFPVDKATYDKLK